jgi:MoxR-like ATPase
MERADASTVARTAAAILDEVERAVIGRRDALEQVLLAVLVGGHVLIEDLPGLGKTLIARSFATVLGLDFARIQFTPDLLPADLTGASIYDPRSQQFVFRPGPVFTQVLLADEINRTPPKTQAALLEAMAEGQVSVDGLTRPLPHPFLVLATSNPIEYEGTYPLPEAQLDRFTLRVRLGYLADQQEAALLVRRIDRGSDTVTLHRMTDAAGLEGMRSAVETVHVDGDLIDYITRLVRTTRNHPDVLIGASSRAALALVQTARAHAVLTGRDFVVSDDVKAVATSVLAHRLSLRPELWVRQIAATDVMASVLDTVPAPPTQPTDRQPARSS